MNAPVGRYGQTAVRRGARPRWQRSEPHARSAALTSVQERSLRSSHTLVHTVVRGTIVATPPSDSLRRFGATVAAVTIDRTARLSEPIVREEVRENRRRAGRPITPTLMIHPISADVTVMPIVTKKPNNRCVSIATMAPGERRGVSSTCVCPEATCLNARRSV
jgi:hypothetical protein